MIRGRPPEFDREHALLEAARLFWRRGYSGTSTRALTAAIGISSSSLYSAFGGKAGLFAEAVEVYADRYAEIYRGPPCAIPSARSSTSRRASRSSNSPRTPRSIRGAWSPVRS
ncbi:helix-turn-helix transcriptional regulator [Brevibacterium casei]|nr:helix-turn-helix transcriptional regulator [Brevibacterium casei]